MEKIFNINGQEVKVQNFTTQDGVVSFSLSGKNYSYKLIMSENGSLVIDDGTRFNAHIGSPNADGERIVMTKGREAFISPSGKKSRSAKAHAGGLTSPMPGKIFKIVKEVGSVVKKGETILILEAMKMEHSIRSDKDGKVKKIFFKTGELVQGGVTLAEVE